MLRNWVNCKKAKVVIVTAMLICSQAQGSAYSTCEGSETRLMTSTKNNSIHERPTAQVVDDVVRYSDESLRVRNKHSNITDAADNLTFAITRSIGTPAAAAHVAGTPVN